MIPVLKSLRFLDDAGKPTQRYFDFLDDNEWSRVLGKGVEDAYEDLFRLDRKANTLDKKSIIGKLRSLTQGKKSDKIVTAMATTFLELSKLSNFSTSFEPVLKEPEVDESGMPNENQPAPTQAPKSHVGGLTYRIEVVLPTTRDKAVYDAIFRSLKEHLL